MKSDDCESLLLYYFSHFDNASDEDINMFIITAVTYLICFPGPSTTTSGILEKMISVAEAISHRKRRDTHRVEDAEDVSWIWRLKRMQDKLSGEDCAKLFRRLLHVFESSYLSGALVGDQDDIRQLLHLRLEAAHLERTCEVADCPWVSHFSRCPWFGNECNLLPTVTAAELQHSEHENHSAAPALDAEHAISLDPARTTHEPSPVHPHLEHLAPRWSSSRHIYADPFPGGPTSESDSAGRSTRPLLGHLPATLEGEEGSDPGLMRRQPGEPSLRPPDASIAEPALCGKNTDYGAQEYIAPPGTGELSESREQVATEHPTGDGPNARSQSLETRDAGGAVAENFALHLTLPQTHMLDGSTDSASVRTLTVGAAEPLNASAMTPSVNTVADRSVQHDIPQDFPLRPVIAVEGSLPGERAAAAPREEGSPIRAAAILFQGEAAVSEHGGEIFELTRRNEGAGEEVQGGGGVDANS